MNVQHIVLVRHVNRNSLLWALEIYKSRFSTSRYLQAISDV